MKKIFYFLFSVAIILLLNVNVYSQVYNACKGQNAVYEESVDDVTGEVQKKMVDTDRYGNAAGNQYDLAVDGAFEGETIVVLHLYTGEGFDFHLPQEALKEKGFSVFRYLNYPPTPEELKKSLDKACQLWVISGPSRVLSDEHIAVIKEYFDEGHGVYIWGDNDPYYADANAVADALFDGKMEGNYWGDKVVNLKDSKTVSGLVPGHLVTTGLQYVYEGITIAKITGNQYLQPLIYSSDGNVVAAFYDFDGKRAIIDGGFTRLYVSWDAAGTGRYVKNAAAWLVNYERFGDDKTNREPKKEE